MKDFHETLISLKRQYYTHDSSKTLVAGEFEFFNSRLDRKRTTVMLLLDISYHISENNCGEKIVVRFTRQEVNL